MKFDVTILGVNSAIPVHGRHPSCQVVNYNEKLILVDCGEGAQIQLDKFKIRKNKIEHIFISHLHGDHCYGLPGLLTTMSLQGRNAQLNVHGPTGIKDFLNCIFNLSGGHMTYPLEIIEYDAARTHTCQAFDHLDVQLFPMKHRMPTLGFRFQELELPLNIDPEKINEYMLTIEEIKLAKKGIDIERDEYKIPFTDVTFPRRRAKSYSYCSDTVYDLELVQFIKGSSLLYHETTYLDDLESLAKERMHSTLGQAISIAQKSDIQRLIVGHYSSRYGDPVVFLQNGKDLFDGLLLGEEGRTYPV